MITVQAATTYSMNQATEMAFEVEYSDGTKVRAVTSKTGFIRKEWKKGESWVLSGKPYMVEANKKRAAERTINICKEFLAN